MVAGEVFLQFSAISCVMCTQLAHGSCGAVVKAKAVKSCHVPTQPGTFFVVIDTKIGSIHRVDTDVFRNHSKLI